jgi:hypothetical protein
LLARWLGATFQLGAAFGTGLIARTNARIALGGVKLA